MFGAAFSIILTLILVVGVHEAGHAIAAKIFSVSIERIAIGFGRPVFLWKMKNGLEIVWGILPLGGYVQLLDSRKRTVETEDLATCFDKQPFMTRFIILIAGGLANGLLAIIALTFFFMIGFRYVPPVIPSVIPNSIAATAGLKANDKIIAIDNSICRSWKDVARELFKSFGEKKVSLKVEDLGHQQRELFIDLSKKLSLEGTSFYTALGIPLDEKKHVVYKMPGKPIKEALQDALVNTWQWLIFYIMMIKQLVTGTVPFSLLLGPISIFLITVQSFGEGLATFLYYIASFSIAVGLVNLLPIPSLDGGAIVFALIEKIRGKAISPALEFLIYRLSMIVFLMFFMHLIMNDLHHYFARRHSVHSEGTPRLQEKSCAHRHDMLLWHKSPKRC